MKQFLRGVVVFFWSVVASVWLWSQFASAPDIGRTPPDVEMVTAEMVARHNQPTDCWILIRGQSYDITAYIAHHPSAPDVVTRYCGTDATVAFETKDRARPHSVRAWSELETLRVRGVANVPP